VKRVGNSNSSHRTYCIINKNMIPGNVPRIVELGGLSVAG
jgi:hypothetical protein